MITAFAPVDTGLVRQEAVTLFGRVDAGPFSSATLIYYVVAGSAVAKDPETGCWHVVFAPDQAQPHKLVKWCSVVNTLRDIQDTATELALYLYVRCP